MSSRVHLVRHTESVHNVDHDFTRLDPELTLLGRHQAEDICRSFTSSDEVGVIVASPLRRTIETTLLAFANTLDKRYFDEASGKGITGGAELILDPDLQGHKAQPCDTGSDHSVLETIFPNLDFSGLPTGWQAKEGLYAPDALDERVRKVRGVLAERAAALKSRERRDIVVVTHGGIMSHLSGDAGIKKLTRAGWRTYTLEQCDDGSVFLAPTSRQDSGRPDDHYRN
ncbi:histidine phosphatase superfamily [Lipomyces doorenjongii]